MKSFILLLLLIVSNGHYIAKRGNYLISSETLKINDVLLINNMKYREGVFDNKLNIVLTFNKLGYYNITTKYNNEVTLKYIKFPIKTIHCDRDNDLYGKNILCKFNYNYHKKHYLNIVGNIRSFKGDYVTYHNKKVITNYNRNNYEIYNKLIGFLGNNNIEITMTNKNGLNCPRYKNGYTNTRYISAWIEDLEEENNKTLEQDMEILVSNVIGIKNDIGENIRI